MELDADIGKVMDEIRKDAPNTIVIVTADNGAWLDAYPDAGTTPFRGEKGFKDVLNYFGDGDVMVINNTKVFPARLYGTKKEKQRQDRSIFVKRTESRSKVMGCFG